MKVLIYITFHQLDLRINADFTERYHMKSPSEAFVQLTTVL